jgi:hypothetical protein
MGIISLLRALIEVATAFLQLRREALIYELISNSEHRQQSIRDRIEMHRNQATENGAQNADQLRVDLAAEKKKYEKYLNSID